MAACLFELRGETVAFGGAPVLHDVRLAVRPGERVAVMGRSGAGKSTLLGLLYQRRAAEIALVPQAAALVKPLSVFHNVYMGRLDRHGTLYNLRNLLWPARREVDAVAAVLAEVGLADKLQAAAGTLSGGQQQRTSLARALFNGRPVLIGDEPVSALDRVQGSALLALTGRRFETVIVALHDIQLALEHARRIVVLERGRVALDAPAAALTAADLLPYYGG